MIFTSIPYDSGWQVFVDGKRVDTHGILGDSTNENETEGSLVAFSVKDAGTHKIELKYRPTAFTFGLTLSIVGIVILILLCIFEKKINKFATRILCPIVIPEYIEEAEVLESAEEKSESSINSETLDRLPQAEALDITEMSASEKSEPTEAIDENNFNDGGN